MKTRYKLFAGLVTSLVFFTNTANAEDEQIAYGQHLSGSCVTCHVEGETDGRIPNIIGWDVESFVEVMELYKKKELENPTMQVVAGALSTDEMKALAAYYKSLAPKEEKPKAGAK